jgi:hypothetical protein
LRDDFPSRRQVQARIAEGRVDANRVGAPDLGGLDALDQCIRAEGASVENVAFLAFAQQRGGPWQVSARHHLDALVAQIERAAECGGQGARPDKRRVRSVVTIWRRPARPDARKAGSRGARARACERKIKSSGNPGPSQVMCVSEMPIPAR